MKRWFAEDVIDNAGVFIGIADLEGTITLFNKKAEELTGVSKEDVLGKNWKDIFVTGDEREEVIRDYHTYVDKGIFDGDDTETHIPTASGELRLIKWHNTVLRDDSGEPKGVMFIGIDITEERQSEISLKESETQYRSLFESSSDAVMLLDKNTFLDCNTATMEMFGISTSEEFTNLHPSEISPPEQANGNDSRSEADARIDEAYKRGHNKFEWLHKRSNGDVFNAEVWLTAFAMGGKRVLQATVRDITERKAIKEELERRVTERTSKLAESEAKFRDLIENINEVLFTVSANGTISYMSPAIKTVFGVDPEEIIGKNYIDFIHPDDIDLLLQGMEDALAGKEHPSECRIVLPSGDPRWVHARNSPILEDGNIIGVQGILEDITEKKATEEALIESEGMYKQLVERSNDGIILAKDGKIAYANAGITNIIGFTNEELVGSLFTDFLGPKEKKIAADRYKRRMAGENVKDTYSIEVKRKDGVMIQLEVKAGIVKYHGEPADMAILREVCDNLKRSSK